MNYRQRQTKFNGIFDDIIKVTQTVLPFVVGQSQSGNSGQAKGLAAISARGAEVIAKIDSILSQLTPSNCSQLIPAIEQLAGLLGNVQYFYQPKSGKDKAELDRLKGIASQKLQQAQAICSQTSTTTQTVLTTNSNGQIVTQQIPVSTQNNLGIDKNYLYIGAGLLAIFLLKR